MLINELRKFINNNGVKGTDIFVELCAVPDKIPFYEKFGFHKRPFGNHGSGMSVWMSRNASGEITNY